MAIERGSDDFSLRWSEGCQQGARGCRESRAYLKLSLPNILRSVKSRSTFWPSFLLITPGMTGDGDWKFAVQNVSGRLSRGFWEVRNDSKLRLQKHRASLVCEAQRASVQMTVHVAALKCLVLQKTNSQVLMVAEEVANGRGLARKPHSHVRSIHMIYL